MCSHKTELGLHPIDLVIRRTAVLILGPTLVDFIRPRDIGYNVVREEGTPYSPKIVVFNRKPSHCLTFNLITSPNTPDDTSSFITP